MNSYFEPYFDCGDLMEAATDGKYACAKDFLKRGAEVNEKDYWHNGCTPLHAACERDNPKLVMLLI